MTLTIGVDVGGTKVAGGVVDEHGNVLASNRRDTPAEDHAGTRDTIVEVAAELAAAIPEATAIGIGAAAWIDAAGSTVLFAPNLAWRDEPLRDYVTKAVGLPTVLENDANVAAWAEFRFGAARHADDSMVMITVGTGIGGGMVLNGALLARRQRHRRRAGPHPVRAGRPPLRMRPARLPRAVRQRQRPGPVRPGRRAAGAGSGRAAARPGRRRPAGDQRPAGHPGRAARRRGGPGRVRADRLLAGRAMADLAQIFDPQVLVDRRRRDRRG